MKKIVKSLLLVLIMGLFATGTAFAYSITVEADYIFEFYNRANPSLDRPETLGARVYLDYIDKGTIDAADPDFGRLATDTSYTYVYAVENVAFDPDNDNAPGVVAPIHSFSLPVAAGGVTGFGTFGPTDNMSVSFFDYADLINVSWPVPAPGFPTSELLKDDVSNPFFVQSTYELGEVLATIRNDSEFINDVVYSAIVVPGGGSGSNPVPEPGTLLLLGGGLIATGGIRHFRSKKKKQ